MTFLIDPAARLIRIDGGSQRSAKMGFCRANGILQPVQINRRLSWFAAIRHVAFHHHEQLFALQSRPELLLVSLSPQPRTNLILVTSQKSNLCDPGALNELSRLIGLSFREHQVLTLLADGMSPKSISAHQQIAVSTVRSQIKSIFSKSGASSIRDVLHLLGRLPPLKSHQSLATVADAGSGTQSFLDCDCGTCTPTPSRGTNIPGAAIEPKVHASG